METNSCAISNELAWSGQFLNVRIVGFTDPANGSVRTREMAVRKHRVVCVLPLTTDNKIILIRQKRVYFDSKQEPEERLTTEVIAGKVGDIDRGETLEDAGRREMEEETGYVAEELIFLFKESVSAGILSEERFCLLALGARPGIRINSEESDGIEVVPVEIGKIHEFIRQESVRGVEIDSSVRSMLFALMDKIQGGIYQCQQ
jgi:ADP-ribose pyrophosphatase